MTTDSEELEQQVDETINRLMDHLETGDTEQVKALVNGMTVSQMAWTLLGLAKGLLTQERANAVYEREYQGWRKAMLERDKLQSAVNEQRGINADQAAMLSRLRQQLALYERK